MRPSWTYKLRENIISIAIKEKNLGVVIQNNLSPEKHINIIFGDTFRMLRYSLANGISFTDFEKNYNYNDQTKTGICRSNMGSAQEKHLLEVERIQRNAS